jgi:hypothetical protein
VGDIIVSGVMHQFHGHMVKNIEFVTFSNERAFSEQAHDTPRLPTISYWQQHIHEI